ncbi:hypothetical protein GGF50DRAFT_121936 [Schizophyllum commune]
MRSSSDRGAKRESKDGAAEAGGGAAAAGAEDGPAPGVCRDKAASTEAGDACPPAAETGDSAAGAKDAGTGPVKAIWANTSGSKVGKELRYVRYEAYCRTDGKPGNGHAGKASKPADGRENTEGAAAAGPAGREGTAENELAREEVEGGGGGDDRAVLSARSGARAARVDPTGEAERSGREERDRCDSEGLRLEVRPQFEAKSSGAGKVCAVVGSRCLAERTALRAAGERETVDERDRKGMPDLEVTVTVCRVGASDAVMKETCARAETNDAGCANGDPLTKASADEATGCVCEWTANAIA